MRLYTETLGLERARKRGGGRGCDRAVATCGGGAESFEVEIVMRFGVMRFTKTRFLV